jgi:hypothetical protein
MMVLTICTNVIHLSHSFIKYERDIGFMNKFIFILSYEKCSKYKLYIMMSYTNLYLKTFSFELIYCFKMFKLSLASVEKNTPQRVLCRVLYF